MKTVITYGTYDLLHYGHIRLLERAKALGDYLIVGVTSDDFDRTRGKINVQQSLAERVAAVKETGLADQIIVEEYEGQKIDDIQRYGVDIFTVGSDWVGKFDYLNEYCKVVYLERTEGVSSSQIRSKNRELKLGMIGETPIFLNKFQAEDKYVNGVEITGICTEDVTKFSEEIQKLNLITKDPGKLIANSDAVYIKSEHSLRYDQIKEALEAKKNVLCESPIALSKEQCKELFDIADKNKCVLMDAIRTAYSTAYSRLLLLVKSGKIGNVVSVEATCTSIRYKTRNKSLLDWGANALLPVFDVLGTNYKNKTIITRYKNKESHEDSYTQINFVYDDATATIKVAEGAKSEGSLVITGTEGYIYVPAPWWKMDYFEVRYEDQENNKRYFYQLDGEGIRYELVAFARAAQDSKKNYNYVSRETSMAICDIMHDYLSGGVIELK